jgi:hypothetical protein
LIVLAPDFMTKMCKKAAQHFHCAVSKVFDRVKSVALMVRKYQKTGSLWYSRFEVTCLLRDNSKRKTRVRFVYVLPEVLHGDFLSEIEYLVNLE